MEMIARFLLVVFAALATMGLSVAASAADQPLTFEQHVRPILKVHCFQCHGEEEKEANLDLRLVRLIAKGGDSGPAIVAGKGCREPARPANHRGRDAAGRQEQAVSAEDLATIRAWIDQGAKTARPEPETLAAVTDDERAFWSFQPLASPPLPPCVRRSSLRSPIDAFLLAELAQAQAGFFARSRRRTLIRRGYFRSARAAADARRRRQSFAGDDSPDA